MAKRYDVFLSFKYLGPDRKPTRDSVLAEDIYQYLFAHKLSVFLSTHELEAQGVSAYKKAIDAALDASRVLIAVGTSTENLESEWVRYEWDGFFNDIISGVKPDGRVFSYTEGIESKLLPRALRQSQALTHGDGSFELLYRFVANALKIEPVPAQVIAKPCSENKPSPANPMKELEQRATKAQCLPTFEMTCPNPSCGRMVALPFGIAGSSVKCPFCFQTFSVPGDQAKEEVSRISASRSRPKETSLPELLTTPAKAGTAPAPSPPHPSLHARASQEARSKAFRESAKAADRPDTKLRTAKAATQEASIQRPRLWLALLGASILLVVVGVGFKIFLGRTPRSESPASAALKPEVAPDKESAAIAAAEASFQKGESHYQKKEWDQAIAEYSEAIRRNRKLADAYYKRSLAYDQLGDRLHAEDDYQTAVTLKPSLKP